MSGGHIFISYRSIEADFALRLAADLKNAGVNVWLDRFELKPGDDWARGIEQGIDTCAAMLIALSPDYVESQNCMRELSRATRMNLPLFPVLLREVIIPLELELLQYADFRDWRDERIYHQKVAELVAALPAAQKGPVPDAETRYLTSLIAELEARKGVLEYVELSGQADAPEEAPARPDPYQFGEWAAGFSMLVETPLSAAPALSPQGKGHQNREKIALKSIAEAVEKHPRFVLIGEPGAGKTTTIRKLARDAARARLDNPRTAPLPLFLYLPQWGDEPRPLDFVRVHWPFNNDPAGVLQQGDVLLYLDGLNEMGAKGAEKAEKLRKWLAAADAPARVIVTCRARDYAGELKLGDLPTVLAEELSEDQIREFSTSYLQDKSGAFLKRILPDDYQRHEANRSLFHLARNPYLLSALIFVYDNAPDGDLPRNNGALMQALTRALWERERQKQTPGWIPFDQMEEKFGKLAFAMIDENRPIDVPVEDALKHLGEENLFKVGHSANLIEMRGEEVRFYHQLMQEYFAAVKLKLQGIQSISIGMVLPTGRDNRWDQVVIALYGILSHKERKKSNEYLLQVDPWLLCICIENKVIIPDAIRAKLRTLLLSKIFQNPVWKPEHGASAWALARVGGDLAIPEILKLLRHKDYNVRETGVWILENLDLENTAELESLATPELIRLLGDPIQYVQDAAATALERIGTPQALEAVARWWAEQPPDRV